MNKKWLMLLDSPVPMILATVTINKLAGMAATIQVTAEYRIFYYPLNINKKLIL